MSREVGEKLVARIKWWEEYTARNGGEMNNNPSPGNKAGGLTTILEKSLGAVAKGGTTNLVDVYEYAAAGHRAGLRLHGHARLRPGVGDRPGRRRRQHDRASPPGRGSAYGCAPAPSLKLATNTALWTRQEEDMDINCGEIVDGRATIEDTGARLFALMLETASGDEVEERAPRLRPERVRALAAGRGDVSRAARRRFPTPTGVQPDLNHIP